MSDLEVLVLEFMDASQPQRKISRTDVHPFYEIILNEIREEASHSLRLVWQGHEIPSGIELPTGDIISWTEAGRVISQSNEDIGVCDRVRYAEGPKEDEHEMYLYIR